ncbi:MAG: creatininase family protein [Halanaerobiaceae bacterium]
MDKVMLNEFTATELKEMLAAGELDSIITIFGSCESHGWHMPLGPDLFVPEEIAKRAARKLDKTVVAPGLPYGASKHYNQYPLSVSLEFETVTRIAEDMFRSLIKHGIQHIFILNGHDGNIPALEIAARNVKDDYKEVSMFYLPAWWEITGEEMTEDFEVWNGLGHGGEGETSITKAVKPDLVDLDAAKSQVPWEVINTGRGHGTIIWDIKEITKTGATGDSTKASLEKGEKMLDIVVNYVVEVIKDLEENNWNYENKK